MNQLEQTYEEIANLTLKHCHSTCRKLGACCEAAYCEAAIYHAKERGIILPRTENQRLPLLTAENTCSAPPYLRPMCALHSCDISSLGFFKNDQGLTRKYFQLREIINELEERQLP